MKFEEEIKTVLDDPGIRTYLNVMYTGNFLNERTIQVLKPYNINDQHYNILRILRGRYPGTACPGEVKEVLINKRGDLTRLLDKLVTLGYVRRDFNVENRRMIDLQITKKGLKFLDKVEPEMKEIQVITSNLTNRELEDLSQLLDKLRG